MSDWSIVVFVMATGFVGLTVAVGVILWNINPSQETNRYATWAVSPYPLVRPRGNLSVRPQVKQVPTLKRVPVEVHRVW
jgi:hypothetical protein